MVSSYIAHIQCSVRFTHNYYTWSLDLFIYLQFQHPFLEHTALAAISALGTKCRQSHLFSTRYSFTPGSNEACECKVPRPRTQQRNNVPILRGEKHDISMKILHQAGFETARQAVTLAKLRALMKWNESGFRPPLCTYRLNWARRTSWGWWDDWDDTVLQTQDSKFEPWRSEAEHATSRSRRQLRALTISTRK